MKYKELRKYKYDGKGVYNNIFAKRFNDENTFHLELDVNGNEAFLCCSKELIILVDKIVINTQKLSNLENMLPPVALKYNKISCLIDEITMSNGIEGVTSTRREIFEAYNSISKKHNRFVGLTKKYDKLFDDSSDIDVYSAEGIRRLYDELLLDDIIAEDPNDAPDGKLFRTDKVLLSDPKQNLIHGGILPESSIIKHVEKAIKMLSQEDIPFLFRVAIFHYYIGYIHPFYNGNGRLSRFISSYLLSCIMSPLASIRLAYIINENKNQYYKVFKETNDKDNRGDLTPFTISFISYINKSIEDMADKLESGKKALDYAWILIDNLVNGKLINEDERTILWLLSQNAFFAEQRFTIIDLASEMNVSRSTMQRMLDIMINKNIPIKYGMYSRKKTVILDMDLLKTFAEEYDYSK